MYQKSGQNVIHVFSEKNDFHPKTLIEMWIICLDPVSANSENCIGSQEIAVEIREKRSSPKVGSGTNHRRTFVN